jgi:hypothetical protein
VCMRMRVLIALGMVMMGLHAADVSTQPKRSISGGINGASAGGME